MQVMRISDRVLPALGRGDLPEPSPLRRMIGPSVILAGLSIGSGEFVLWPRLTAEWGFALFWACWIGVTIQFFLNMEIERWTLATGESAVVGFARLSRAFVPVFLLCGTVPWIWPGWATGAATLLSWQIAVPITGTAVAGLVACGLILSLGPVVYRTVEVIQFVLVAGIFTALVILAAVLVSGDTVMALAAGAVQFGRIPEGVELPMLLGALAFAGAGGSVNLAQSNYIKDKGYGMGRSIGRITSPFTGQEEASSVIGVRMRATSDNLERWRIWWRRSNIEHFISFYVLCVASLALLCLITYSLLEPGAPVAEGLGFIRAESETLGARFGPFASHLFLLTGIAVLFSTELALLDAVTRVLADVLRGWWRRASSWSLSRLYMVILWSLIVFGIAVVTLGLNQPLLLLILSASLNAFVMFLYSGLLLWLNLRTFHGPLRPHPLRCVALISSLLFFGYFSGLTLWSQLAG